MTFSVEIDVPPTANNIYVNAKKGRVKSDAYAAWRTGVALQIQAQVRPSQRIAGPVMILIDLPWNMAGDLDNRVKPSLDALVASGRIDDDRNVVELRARKILDRTLARITVTSATVTGAGARIVPAKSGRVG